MSNKAEIAGLGAAVGIGCFAILIRLGIIGFVLWLLYELVMFIIGG